MVHVCLILLAVPRQHYHLTLIVGHQTKCWLFWFVKNDLCLSLQTEATSNGKANGGINGEANGKANGHAPEGNGDASPAGLYKVKN